jgi:hypothetical protein
MVRYTVPLATVAAIGLFAAAGDALAFSRKGGPTASQPTPRHFNGLTTRFSAGAARPPARAFRADPQPQKAQRRRIIEGY